jgi:hypothetical protein
MALKRIAIVSLIAACLQHLENVQANGLGDVIAGCGLPEVMVMLYPQQNYGGNPYIMERGSCGFDTQTIFSAFQLPNWNSVNDGEIGSIKVSEGCEIDIYNGDGLTSRKYANPFNGREDYKLISPVTFTSDAPRIDINNMQAHGTLRRRDIYFGGRSVHVRCHRQR